MMHLPVVSRRCRGGEHPRRPVEEGQRVLLRRRGVLRPEGEDPEEERPPEVERRPLRRTPAPPLRQEAGDRLEVAAPLPVGGAGAARGRTERRRRGPRDEAPPGLELTQRRDREQEQVLGQRRLRPPLLLEPPPPALEAARDQRQREGLLAGVVVEEGAGADARGAGDLAGGRPLEAAAAEEPGGGAEDPPAGPLPRLLGHAHGLGPPRK